MLLFRDVSELYQLQEERQKVRMMKMVSAMVSHDLMHPLATIRLFADQLKKQLYQINEE